MLLNFTSIFTEVPIQTDMQFTAFFTGMLSTTSYFTGFDPVSAEGGGGGGGGG